MKFNRCAQLSVYLENRVGALADICKIIEQKSINLIAICAIDTVDEAVLRIVPEDHEKTRDALTALSMHVIETEVLAIEIPNIPGATGKVASLLAEAGINIDYIYSAAHPEVTKATLILRTHSIDEAEKVLLNAS
ncbi:MAG: ACT domain-containing protein [Deltaproteobacteria bacterium]|jgi:hypothetical protein|nr:ACT domain-containing protein [Deltaproteobacteria bacterium]